MSLGEEAGTEKWRVFIAIELPAEIRRQIVNHGERLRKQLPDAHASWSRESNLHLTLKFLGDTPVAKCEALSKAVKRAASDCQPFEVAVEGCGSFPPRAQPRVLWIGVAEATGRLEELQRRLEDECARERFPREQRAFHPHLTLARLRKPQGARQLGELHRETGFEKMIFTAADLCLIRSELSPQGSRYTVIARHQLGNSAAMKESSSLRLPTE